MPSIIELPKILFVRFGNISMLVKLETRIDHRTSITQAFLMLSLTLDTYRSKVVLKILGLKNHGNNIVSL